MPAIIEVSELTKTYGAFTAVDSISFEVASGECFGILGPNGAGKTTTIRMLYGFSPPAKGTLRVFGLEIREHAREIKARVGVCQQENNLDPDLTIIQNLQVYASYFNIPAAPARRKAEELLEFMSLSQKRNARAVELSGGMMRRTTLARSLINDPKLLILDEPTTGLDPQSRHQVWERLEDLKARGLTILLTTHYMEEAARLCDRLFIMDHGRILVEGSPADLIEKHVGRDVLELSRPSAELRREVKSWGLPYDDLGQRILVYGSDRNGLYGELRKNGSLPSFQMRMATLEDVFLKLTGRELRE